MRCRVLCNFGHGWSFLCGTETRLAQCTTTHLTTAPLLRKHSLHVVLPVALIHVTPKAVNGPPAVHSASLAVPPPIEPVALVCVAILFKKRAVALRGT
eukprot:363965-Chlamydomonas_euryale.AAC.12